MTEFVHLSNRGILALTGKDALDLLQGALTQDVRKLADTPLLYATHLTPQGKLVTDVFLWQQDDALMLDVHVDMLMPLAQSLNRYCVGMDVEFEDLSADYCVCADISPTPTHGCSDPRHTALGSRFYATQCPSSSSLDVYEAYRISLGIPDVFVDFPNQNFLPAELGLHHLNAIDFDKGCYVGQEVTTRLHRRGTPKKALYVLDAVLASVGSPITLESGTTTGKVGATAGDKTLAALQIRSADKPLFCQEEKIPTPRLSPIYPN
ncbi:MAG: hypothetical protein OXR68_08235 [Alphaproteobacteria bacterium]|nr:hypothetical protein [Alphaproteobacteria bacterium]MDD9920593.1 hypothetical protein [Alphaproteobacteria bacterium]